MAEINDYDSTVNQRAGDLRPLTSPRCEGSDHCGDMVINVDIDIASADLHY